MDDFVPKQDIFHRRSAPKTKQDLSRLVQERVHLPCSPFGLEQFLSRNPMYLRDVIPFLWEQAKEEVPTIQPLHLAGTIELTQYEALRILIHSFFCSFERDSYRWKDYPSINMDRLFLEPNQIHEAKLSMFFEYFSRQYKRWIDGDKLDRRIRFHLRSSSKKWEDWAVNTKNLQPFVVHSLKDSLDQAKDS